MRELVIDVSALAYKSFYSMPRLSYQEQEVAVVFGFLGQILKLAASQKSNYFVFCFDSKKSHRKIAYPSYKCKRNANRKEMTTEEKIAWKLMQEQVVQLHESVLPALGWDNRVFKITGLESDDLMASIVANNVDSWTLVTSDEDMYQCLANQVDIFNPAKKCKYTADDFRAEYGIDPNQWASVKAMAGCSSDNVEGLVGIGEGNAIKFLRGELKHGKKKPSLKLEAIEKGQEIIARNRPLVTLPHEKCPEIYVPPQRVLTRIAFENMFYKFGFNSYLKSIDQWVNTLKLK